jgi:hypothetical protein
MVPHSRNSLTNTTNDFCESFLAYQRAARDSSLADMSNSSGFSETEKPDVGFVACIERGVLASQALLLFKSIRLHTGSFKDCAIYALSPRAECAISSDTRRRLDDLRVHDIDTILNSECREYGSANRVAAVAYIEETYRHKILVILDSKLWGSNQATLSLAIWSTSKRVQQLPPTYNYPLHLHDRVDPVLAWTVFPHLVHLHYHWLFSEDALPANPLFLPSGPLSSGQRDWLRSAIPIG